MLSLCLAIKRFLRGTSLGFCLRVIVNEKPLNLEKMRCSVLSICIVNRACITLKGGSLAFNYAKSSVKTFDQSKLFMHISGLSINQYVYRVTNKG